MLFRWRGQFARFEAAIWRFLREIGRDCCRGAEFSFFRFIELVWLHVLPGRGYTRYGEVRTFVPCRLLCGCGGMGRVMTRLVHDLCIDALSGEACA